MKTQHTFTTALLACFSAGSPLQQSPEPRLIQLPGGRYHGLSTVDSNTTVYYNVRYGHAARFEPPQPLVSTFNGTFVNATSPGPACMNFNIPGEIASGLQSLLGTAAGDLEQVEDCLSMDIYVPNGLHDSLPVLVYIPGGGFTVGYSAGYDMRPMIDRAQEIERPMIGVVVNYRLGAFGFLNPSTAKDDGRNIGLSDQVEAFRFVKKYIHRVGGDFTKVTIMGQSAGAASVMQHVLQANGLFRAAWLASVPSSFSPYLGVTPRSNNRQISQLAEAVHCTSNATVDENIACLRTIDAFRISNASDAWEGASLQYGGIIKKNVFHAIRRGDFAKVPLVVSTTRDEGTSLTMGFKSDSDEITAYAIDSVTNSAARFNESITAIIQQQFLAAYPNNPSLGAPFDGRNTTYGQPSQYKRMAAIQTDTLFTEAFTEYIQTFARFVPTWGMYYTSASAGPANETLGAYHGSDLAYYFPTVQGGKNDPRRWGRGDLVREVQDAVVSFVWYGDPNGEGRRSKGRQVWPLWKSTHRIAGVDDARGVFETCLPYRSAFHLIRKWFRPDDF